MKVNISYVSTKYYDAHSIIQWAWMFKKYRHVKGFILRVFGVYLNIRENRSTEKLTKLFVESRRDV